MTYDFETRRHSDGSIDSDFYHKRAVMLRMQARRDPLNRNPINPGLALRRIGLAMTTAFLVASIPIDQVWHQVRDF